MDSRSLSSVPPPRQVAPPPQHAVATRDTVWAPLLTPRQAAAFLQVPETTLAVWRSTGRVDLPYLKVGGHVRYRHQEDIERYLAGRHHSTGVSEEQPKRPKPPSRRAAPTKATPYVSMREKVEAFFAAHGALICDRCGDRVEDIDARIVTAADVPGISLSKTADVCLCADCNLLGCSS